MKLLTFVYKQKLDAMIITFQIHYRTVWGETLKVIFPNRLIDMSTQDGYLWTGSFSPDSNSTCVYTYYYGVFIGNKCIRSEWHITPHVLCPGHLNHNLIHDNWRDIPADSYFFSTAFTHLQGEIHNSLPQPDEGKRMIIFRATCAMLPSSKHLLSITGDKTVLGCWDPKQSIEMHQIAPHQWMGAICADQLPVPFEYKFIARNINDPNEVLWELGNNRQWQRISSIDECIILPETDVHFEQLPLRLAGTAIPVFSLRSEKSFGVGDFGDLKRMVDWAVQTHQEAIQILPINDSTTTHHWTDSYPYKSISIYALHPMYMDLNQLGKLADPSKQKDFEQLQTYLNSLDEVDYEQVNQAKWKYIRLKYEEEGEQTLESESFHTFFKANETWLRPYAAFSYLRDKYKTPDYSQWPSYSVYNQQEVQQLTSPQHKEYTEIAFFYYMQYQLHNQLLATSDYARQKGVILKGDIPIGVSRYSVETWTEPHYFNLNGQAGAPPDPFSTNGQNWGFPTYNWERMKEDNYQWWQNRFSKMAEYFTAYRIDHILGFFRIWEIPSHAVHGLLGQFVPSLPLSPQEIESFGLPFKEEFYTQPYIDDRLLNQLFGYQAINVKEKFIIPIKNGLYKMRPEFATQRQVEAYFANKEDAQSIRMRNGLYALISNVLFIRDRQNPNRFHPRIMAQNDYFYTQLNRYEKGAFARLHQHYYYERHNNFWYEEAMKKLPLLTQCTRMLACGEDLGMIPACVPSVMNQLHILSLEIERMPKEFGNEFGEVEKYPYSSVCTLSTHDMSTLRGWWKENPSLTKNYYHHILKESGNTPEDINAALCAKVIARQLSSPSMLCILSWQDWMSIDETLRCKDIDRERINVPANPLNYWRYRMHITLETLMKADKLNEHIRCLIDEAQRCVNK